MKKKGENIERKKLQNEIIVRLSTPERDFTEWARVFFKTANVRRTRIIMSWAYINRFSRSFAFVRARICVYARIAFLYLAPFPHPFCGPQTTRLLTTINIWALSNVPYIDLIILIILIVIVIMIFSVFRIEYYITFPL